MRAQSKALIRDAALAGAASKALGAGSRFGGLACQSEQNEDKKYQAEAERDIDRAKADVDAAATASRRAEEDIRETVAAVRQYSNAKTQLTNAAAIRA